MTAPSVGLAGQGLNFTVSEVDDVLFSDIPMKKQPSTETEIFLSHVKEKLSV